MPTARLLRSNSRRRSEVDDLVTTRQPTPTHILDLVRADLLLEAMQQESTASSSTASDQL